MKRLVTVVALLTAVSAFGAEDVDPASLYELSTEGSTAALKSGERGKFVLTIRTKPEAHVSDEAPLKLELGGQKVQVAKSKLTLADSVAKKKEGQAYAEPRFEVPITGTEAGKGVVDGKLTFFICTEKLCARQQRNVSVPVTVEAAGGASAGKKNLVQPGEVR
ncbi:MAG: hypothetical protein L0Y66_24595 [Myxococcaceae bacterium]|nr:hypothetical protein [Myxococcaceae bacterium]MCI0669728.1 hypothetical protein [Myxococcaceae bacterium]